MAVHDQQLIARIRAKECDPSKLAACDLITLARMVRDGDLIHVDEPMPAPEAAE
jgi:hypothetical protein